ncbi:MAG TPA: hypothetical protein VL992_14985 [Tepidisphaeraceae bacterium]|nr:hypothetical protein [Tepidisphaeraceae bacterium]
MSDGGHRHDEYARGDGSDEFPYHSTSRNGRALLDRNHPAACELVNIGKWLRRCKEQRIFAQGKRPSIALVGGQKWRPIANIANANTFQRDDFVAAHDRPDEAGTAVLPTERPTHVRQIAR